MITVYQYPRCSTCKKALRWLEAEGIAVKLVDIVQAPPPRDVLQEFVSAGIPVRKLFNTSGELYREGKFKERLAHMSDADALDALAAHGKLIKRPLVVGDGIHLVGFREEEYAAALR